MRRESREEDRCGKEGEEHRGENQEGTRLTDRDQEKVQGELKKAHGA